MQAITSAIQNYSDRTRYNLLVPPTFAASQVGGLYQVSFREVSLDPDPKAKEVYTYTGLNGYAIGRAGLDKLAALAGITWNHMDSGFLDAPRGMMRYRAVGALRNSDGTPIIAMATKTHFYASEVPQNFDAEKVETKAKNRVIRQLLGIKPTYSQEELKRPFVVLRVDLALDMNDPNIKMLVAQKAVDMMTNLFGAPAPTSHQLAAPAPAMLPMPAAQPQLGPGTVLPESNAPDPEDLIDDEADSHPAVGDKCATCPKTLSDKDKEYTVAKGKPGQCYSCRQAKKPVTPAAPPAATPKPAATPEQAWAKLNEIGHPIECHDPNGFSGKFPTVDQLEVMSEADRKIWDPRIDRAIQIAKGQGTLPLANQL